MKNLFNIKLSVLCFLGFLSVISCQQQDEVVTPAVEVLSLSMEEADQISKDYFVDKQKSTNSNLRELRDSKSLDFKGVINEGADAGTSLMGILSISSTKSIGSASGYTIVAGNLKLSDDSELSVRGLALAKRVYLFFEDSNGSLALKGKGMLEDDSYEGEFVTANGSRGSWTATLQAPPTIVEIAVADARLYTLVAALSAAELVETLSGPGPRTDY